MIYKNKQPNPSKNSFFSDISTEENDNMPLLAKVPNLSFDTDRLVWCLKNIVMKEPIFWAGEATEKRPMRKYGGWSLTSNNGNIHDGWQSVAGWENGQFNLKLAYENGYIPRLFHNKKTSICIDYFEEVIRTLEDMGFNPHAVRIWNNPKGGHHIGPHTDNADNRYSARLHIPIITNSGCIHEWYADPEDYKCHIPADGSAYMFRTNILHDTYNFGKEDRYHIIAEVYDTKHVVPGFGYNHIENLKSQAKKEIEFFLGKEKSLVISNN
jgi:hypothetical protein